PRKPGSPVGVEQPNIKRPAGRGLTPPTGPISVAKVVTAASDRSPIIDSKAIGRAKKRRDARFPRLVIGIVRRHVEGRISRPVKGLRTTDLGIERGLLNIRQ